MKPFKEKLLWMFPVVLMTVLLFGCALIWMPTPSDVTAARISPNAIRITWSYDIWSICDIPKSDDDTEYFYEDTLCFRVFRHGVMVGHICEKYAGVHEDYYYPEFPAGEYCYQVQAYCRGYFGIEMGESNKSDESCVVVDPEVQGYFE